MIRKKNLCIRVNFSVLQRGLNLERSKAYQQLRQFQQFQQICPIYICIMQLTWWENNNPGHDVETRHALSLQYYAKGIKFLM